MGQTENNKGGFRPHPLLRIMGDFGNSQMLNAALEYDFFTLVHGGRHTYDEIAEQAGTVPRSTRILLDGLIALGLLDKREGKYFLTPLSEAFLVKGKSSYIGDFRHVAMAPWDGMGRLIETLKTGKPLGRLDTGSELHVWEKLVVGIIPIAEPVARALCDLLSIGVKRTGLRVLDIGGGSSIFGMTILTRDPSAEITQLDWPNVNAVARRLNRERGLDGRIRFIDGEFRTAGIRDGYWDLVLASNFCRFESPEGNGELFRKANRTLKPSGLFIINDFVPNEERTGPTLALRFSVYALTNTPNGECYTLSEYTRWLRDAGFGPIEDHGDIPDTLPGTTLIIAEKEK